MWDCITFTKSVIFWDLSFSSYQKMQLSVPSSSKIHRICEIGMSVSGIFISNKMQGEWYGNCIFKDLQPESAHLHVDWGGIYHVVTNCRHIPRGDKLPLESSKPAGFWYLLTWALFLPVKSAKKTGRLKCKTQIHSSTHSLFSCALYLFV